MASMQSSLCVALNKSEYGEETQCEFGRYIDGNTWNYVGLRSVFLVTMMPVTRLNEIKTKMSVEESECEKHKILRDNIQFISREMILSLAAKAGVMKFGTLLYEEVRGTLKVYLEKMLGEALSLVRHRGRDILLATDVLDTVETMRSARGNMASTMFGTGELGAMYAARYHDVGMMAQATYFSKLAAESTATLRQCGGAPAMNPDNVKDDAGKHIIPMCCPAGFRERDTSAWHTLVHDDDDGDVDYDDDAGHTGEDDDDHRAAAADEKQEASVAMFVRRMQNSSDPVLPYVVITKLIREVTQDYISRLHFEERALQLIAASLEFYLVKIFQHAETFRHGNQRAGAGAGAGAEYAADVLQVRDFNMGRSIVDQTLL
jgi:histone H3/H4